MLLARIYEVLPLLCPACGGHMRILSFITDPPVVVAILEHLLAAPRRETSSSTRPQSSIPKDAKSREIDRAVKESLTTGVPLYELDVELLECLRPDLVITQSVYDVCAVGETQALTCLPNLTNPPAVMSMHPHRFADVMSDFPRLGQAAGIVESASALVDEYGTRVQRVCRRVEGERPVTVVVLEWIDPPFSSGHWTPDLVTMAGGRELLVHVNINTITYKILALLGHDWHLGCNQEADNAQIKPVCYHADAEGTEGARGKGAPVYVIVSRCGTRQDRSARRRGPREQADRRASRYAASRREQVAQALLSKTSRGTRGSFPQRSTLCFPPLEWSPR